MRKVKAMPPPMIILSTLSSMFSMSRILSLTCNGHVTEMCRDVTAAAHRGAAEDGEHWLDRYSCYSGYTLAPPRMASTGLTGVSRTLEKAASSLATRKPEALTENPSPTIDECARWAVPKASLT